MTNEQLLFAYRNMILARSFDHALINLYRQSKIVGGVYAQIGNEATSVGTAMALGDGDYLFPMHRDNGAHFVRGMTPQEMAINFLFRKGAMTRGTDGTGHFADVRRRIYGNVSHLGAMVPVAAGVGLAQKMKKSGNIVLNYIGDGGASVGEVHEGLMMASVMKLPLILVIENNQYAYSTPLAKQMAGQNFSCRAIGYGIHGETVDGTDIQAVFEVTTQAAERARRGEGPTIIESVTMRMRGHAEHDPFDYVPKETLEAWEKKDPIEKIQKLMLELGIEANEIERIARDATKEIDEAVAYANELPGPDPEEAFKNVFVNS
jgi:TPP-dependent pyruvate/acetoin dehydrogenase alpha subunit